MHDGTSWCSGYLHLQDALAAAQAGDTIRVAQGVHRPDQGTGQTPGDRMATFQLITGVRLEGGYAGCGGADPDARDVGLFETILSGDLASDDGDESTIDCCSPNARPGCNNQTCQDLVCDEYAPCCDGEWGPTCARFALDCCSDLCGIDDNSYHVVTASAIESTAVLDGFTIQRGNAHGESFERTGGGLLNITGSPTINNCHFTMNYSLYLSMSVSI